MTKNVCSLLLSILLGGSACLGQSPSPTPVPPPQPPLSLEIPPRSTYTIQISYQGIPSVANSTASLYGEPSPSPTPNLLGDKPVSLQVWRDDKTCRIVVEHANGQKSEGYIFPNGFVVRSTSNSQSGFVSSAPSGRSASTSLFTPHFQGTQWLDMAFYKGLESGENGEAFYIFEQPPSKEPLPIINEANALPDTNYDPLRWEYLRAKLRAPDKKPVEIQIGNTIYHFGPIERWTGTITLPSQYRETVEQYSKELSIIEAFRKKNQEQGR